MKEISLNYIFNSVIFKKSNLKVKMEADCGVKGIKLTVFYECVNLFSLTGIPVHMKCLVLGTALT